MKKVVLITGASSGFGRLAAEALAKAGHTVYASMRDTNGRNAPQVATIAEFSKAHAVDLRTVELDVQSQDSVDAAVCKVIADTGRIDVLIHNAGHMVFGPAEAFTPEQFAQLYDINVLSTQRVNRAVLPHLRRQKQGLLVWVSSSSSAGGTPPYLAPYFAAKAAMDATAVQYARELSRWGIDLDHRARRVHRRHEPLRSLGTPGRYRSCSGVRGGTLQRFRRGGAKGVRGDRSARRRCLSRRHRYCRSRRYPVRQAALPRSHRPDRGWSRRRLHRARPAAQRDAAPGRPVRSVEAEDARLTDVTWPAC